MSHGPTVRPARVRLVIVNYVDCEGCGKRVDLGEGETAHSVAERPDAPGRVTIIVRDEIIHECAEP